MSEVRDSAVSANGEATSPPVYCAHTDLWEIRKVRPNPRNPNRHPPYQIKALAHVIKSNGWRNSIVISKRSGLITKGHARLEAARLLELKLVPVDVQPYETEEDEYADLLADNQIAELAEMDHELLAPLLLELQAKGLDLARTGFSTDEVAALLNSTPEAIDEALRVNRVRLEWGKFKVFHCVVGEQVYCMDRFHYLVSFGTNEGKLPAGQPPPNSTVFVDSGMLTLARKEGIKAAKRQKEIVAYAEKGKAHWVAMMDIPMIPEVLEPLKLKPAAAYELHLHNGREFSLIDTKVRKVFVMQGITLNEYDRCCKDFRAFVSDKDVVAIGSIKDRAQNAKLIAAITATVHKHYPKNDIHLFGVTSPVSVREAVKYGATSADSSNAGNSIKRGEIVICRKRPESYVAVKQSIAELMGDDNLSIGGKLWLALTMFSCAQVEASIALSMAMEEANLLFAAGATSLKTESPLPPEPTL